MTSERFATLKSLFEAVADLSGAERAARLRQLTADEEMIGEVLALHLATTGTTQLSTPIAAALASALCRQPAAGDTIGVWRIEREIGRGGMGSVFLAERSDGHFQQRAAVKLLGGLPHQETLALFTRERQLLATLAHPNIARLLDGGSTPEGQPYLVMEYVDGAHIDEHCRREALSVRAVLALFLTACDTVAFAHRQLVVHCDLKPSNLLIDREGRPVLLDFGIARLTDQVGAESAPAVSAASAASAFTPRYASPELCARGAVSTASDIYSLGVLLGELLAQAGDRATLGALRRRELAAIVERACRRDPAERYANVEGLTAEIRRFLSQQPVQALAGGAGYATRKLLVRRWPWVSIAAAFVLTVVGFTYRVVVESRRAHTAEQAALEQLDRARDAERRALLERDATRLARAEALRERDAAEFARRESDRARDYAREAETNAEEERNRATQAEALSRQTNEFLVSIFANSNPTESGDIPTSKLLTRTGARLESELKGQGATQAELYSALARVEADRGNRQEARAYTLRALAIEWGFSRPLALAETLTRHAALIEKRFASREEESAAREGLASSLYNLAYASQSVGDDESTVAGVRKAITILTPQVAELNPGIPRMRMNLARSLIDLGRIEEAKEELRQSLSVRLALYGERHAYVLSTEVRLAECELRQNDWPAALSRLDRIASLEPAMLATTRWEYRRLRALAVAAQGDLLSALGELEAVETEFAASGQPLLTAWLKKIYRAELLVARGSAAEKAAGQALARQILDAITPQLVPQAPVLGRLRDLLR